MLMVMLAQLVVVSPEPSSANAQGGRVLFHERFAGALGSGWSWVREEPGAWQIENGALRLRSLPGHLHAQSNDSKNLLIRTPPDATGKPLAIEVSLESEPGTQFEHAGLVWYYDDDNYVALYKEHLDGKPKMQMVTESAGKPRYAVAPCETKTVELRLVITHAKVISQYRQSPEEAWRTVGESLLPQRERPRVGITSGGSTAGAERFIRFRDFRIVELPASAP